MARPKKLLVNGTHYAVQVSWGEQKRLADEFLKLRDGDEENEDALGDFIVQLVRDHVKQVEDDGGQMVDLTPANFEDMMTGVDMLHLGLYVVNSPHAQVQVVGSVPFVPSASLPQDTPPDTG